jgi:hypothetical protein
VAAGADEGRLRSGGDCEILQLLNSKYMTAVLVAEIRDGIAHDVSRIDKVLDRLDRRREEWLHFPPGCGAPA